MPQSNLPEALLNTAATAHILGGAVIGADPEHGVVDRHQRAFGYHNLLVCDGSVIPANPGVNPSLTITALAEHAMSHVPPRTPSTTSSTNHTSREPRYLDGGRPPAQATPDRCRDRARTPVSDHAHAPLALPTEPTAITPPETQRASRDRNE